MRAEGWARISRLPGCCVRAMDAASGCSVRMIMTRARLPSSWGSCRWRVCFATARLDRLASDHIYTGLRRAWRWLCGIEMLLQVVVHCLVARMHWMVACSKRWLMTMVLVINGKLMG